jgi:hypothetical protein
MNFEMVLTYLKGSKKRAYRYNWNGIKNVMEPAKPISELKGEFKNPILVSHTQDNITHFNPEVIPKSFPPMFIYMEHKKVIPSEQVWEPQKTWLEGKDMHISDHINLKTTEGNIVPWFPSQEDILSDDWVIID